MAAFLSRSFSTTMTTELSLPLETNIWENLPPAKSIFHDESTGVTVVNGGACADLDPPALYSTRGGGRMRPIVSLGCWSRPRPKMVMLCERAESAKAEGEEGEDGRTHNGSETRAMMLRRAAMMAPNFSAGL